MIKRILSLVSVAVILTSCGNTGKKEASASGDAAKVEFAALASSPGDYIGKNIKVEGKVVHVCMETGKKLFIVGENPDIRLYIQAGDNVAKFPMDLMGSTVEVEGVITKPMAAAMTEGKAMGEAKADMTMSDTCETETALLGQTALADVMMEYKSHVVK